MARTQRAYSQICKEISGRFVEAFEKGMGCTTAEISRRLRYANPTTIQAIRRGDAMPDIARVAAYRADLRDKRGAMLNLHWLITGEGNPFMTNPPKSDKSTHRIRHDDDIIILISRMSRRQRAALGQFLAEIE